jgi:hypothetical protein
MARIALRIILLALVAASLLVIATIVLVRLAPPPAVLTQQVPLDTLAVPLDANGNGMQVLDNAVLSVRIAPYPSAVGQPVTVTLVALDRASGATMSVTPTLSVAEIGQVDGVDRLMAREPSGAYAVSDVLFPRAGAWRSRVRVDFGTGEPYSMLLVSQVR